MLYYFTWTKKLPPKKLCYCTCGDRRGYKDIPEIQKDIPQSFWNPEFLLPAWISRKTGGFYQNWIGNVMLKEGQVSII